MLQFGTSAFNMVVYLRKLDEVDNECSAPHINVACLPSVCRKLSELVEIWRSYAKGNIILLGFETRCSCDQRSL